MSNFVKEMSENICKNYSVVVCSFNKLQYLTHIIPKIRKLRPKSEIILSDDHSTDDTKKWAESCGLIDKIHFENEPGNYRLSTIRNKGIFLASNEYIVLLDGDCLPEDDYFSGHDFVFGINPTCISIGITRRYNSNGTEIRSDDFRISRFNGQQFCRLDWSVCYGGNIAFPKSVWQRIGGFDQNFDGCWGFEDLDFAIRCEQTSIPCFSCLLSSVRHLEHPILKTADDVVLRKTGKNIELFFRKHGIRMV